MTKADYQKLASEIKYRWLTSDAEEKEKVHYAARLIVLVASHDNPRFDSDKFYHECGIQ